MGSRYAKRVAKLEQVRDSQKLNPLFILADAFDDEQDLVGVSGDENHWREPGESADEFLDRISGMADRHPLYIGIYRTDNGPKRLGTKEV